mgnify:CR=1 FL=1
MGITPAWAGKSVGGVGGSGGQWDHPRMGGEKYKVYVYNTVDKGSPPRGRGKVVVSWNLRLFSGITPAWAGKNPWRSVSYRCCGDHPRMGGEKG